MVLLFLKLDVTHRAARKEPDLTDSLTVSTANINKTQTTNKNDTFQIHLGQKKRRLKKEKKKGWLLHTEQRKGGKIAEAQPAQKEHKQPMNTLHAGSTVSVWNSSWGLNNLLARLHLSFDTKPLCVTVAFNIDGKSQGPGH